MNVSYYFKNLESTEALKSYAYDKLDRLKDRLHHIEGIDVRFKVLREQQIFEVTVHADSTVLHLTKSAKDMYAAIDTAVDALRAQIDKHRRKLDSKEGPQDTVRVLPTVSQPSQPEESAISVYAAPAKPMDEFEAILQLRAQNLKFLMYREAHSERYSLVFVRADGNYSVVSPLEDPGQYKERVYRLSNDELEELAASLYPMATLTIAEAMDRLHEGDLEFLAFVNEESTRMNVLFHDKHGDLVLKRPPQ